MRHLGYEMREVEVEVEGRGKVKVVGVYLDGAEFCKPKVQRLTYYSWFRRAYLKAFEKAVRDLILSHKANPNAKNLKNSDGFPRYDVDPL